MRVCGCSFSAQAALGKGMRSRKQVKYVQSDGESSSEDKDSDDGDDEGALATGGSKWKLRSLC